VGPFLKYFFHYIFFSRTRQRLLILAIVGLFLSSFALLVLQGTMGGLQRGVIGRSKRVKGVVSAKFEGVSESIIQDLLKDKRLEGISAHPELEIELLIKNGGRISPVVLHGVNLSNPAPFASDRDISGIVLGSELAYKIHVDYRGEVELIFPMVTNKLLGDVPRIGKLHVTDIFNANVQEIDANHAFVRSSFLQNILRKRILNKVVFYSDIDVGTVKEIFSHASLKSLQVKRWEDENSTLVWALNLENRIMLFLFTVMTLLVAISITSGLFVFFNKIKVDLVSFWIRGKGIESIKQMVQRFVLVLCSITILCGLGAGAGLLYFLDNYEGNIMPAVFVERNIPVHLDGYQIVLAFIIPFGISTIFSFGAFKGIMGQKSSFIEKVRSFS